MKKTSTAPEKPRKPVKSAKKYPTTSSRRFTPEEIDLIEKLKAVTGIKSRSGVEQHCLRIAATHYKINLSR